ALDVFFYEKDQDEQHAMDTLGWMPLVSLIAYMAAFSIGYGPIPWVLMDLSKSRMMEEKDTVENSLFKENGKCLVFEMENQDSGRPAGIWDDRIGSCSVLYS
ncbi:hypothetical protein Pcinc_030289, partial [Petrolisthes cinctipes]